MWRRFSIQMATYAEREYRKYHDASYKAKFSWTPLVYVFETGSKGGRCHVHVLFKDYFEHFYARKHWSKMVTDPNVNFRESYVDKPIEKSVGYLTKYVLKGDYPPRLMGGLLGIDVPRRTGCPVCD